MHDHYTNYYTEDAFWDKIKQEGRLAGATLCRKAFVLYYVLREKSVPTSIETIIKEALGYFISPDDVIPDFVPAVGYTDDMDKIIEAQKYVVEYMDEDVNQKALEALREIFPDR